MEKEAESTSPPREAEAAAGEKRGEVRQAECLLIGTVHRETLVIQPDLRQGKNRHAQKSRESRTGSVSWTQSRPAVPPLPLSMIPSFTAAACRSLNVLIFGFRW